jgi:hypothetical protein
LIYRCIDGHVSFARQLSYCGMKGCEKPIEIVSEMDVEWFYKINPEGLAINEVDLDKILADRNVPKDVKSVVRDVFPRLRQRGFRFW